MMLQLRPTAGAARTRAAASSRSAAAAPAATPLLRHHRGALLRVRFQGPESERVRGSQTAQQRSSGAGPWGDAPGSCSSGYGSDYGVAGSLNRNWAELQRRWNSWDPDERSSTLTLGAGGLLALYVANALVNALDRLPLVPGLLQLVGLSFSAWFAARYLIYADGRRDLARLSLDQLLGRSAHEATSDLRTAAHEAAEGVGDGASRLRRSGTDPVGDALDALNSSGGWDSGSGRLSDGSPGGYTRAELDSDVQGALRDLDQVADNLSGGGGGR